MNSSVVEKLIMRLMEIIIFPPFWALVLSYVQWQEKSRYSPE